MTLGGPSKILVSSPNVGVLSDLRRQLELHGHAVSGHVLGTPDPDALTTYRLVVLDGSGGHTPQALALCERLHPRLEGTFVPVLFVTDDQTPATRLACFEAGADTYLLKPFAPGELTAQVSALLRTKETHDRLTEKTAESHRINKRLQQAYQQIDHELELARRIQSSFLPQTLPQVPNVRFAVHYLLCGRVGGDFYDIFRLDERHVGFYVADAMGHGVPASLLTIFVKKGVRAKEVFGSQYRLVPPDEVLGRLNRDLIDEKLYEDPFITMVYGLFNHQEGILQFARAGHPPPLYVPRDGEPRLLKQEGLLLGVLDAKFPVATQRLLPGDKLLFYSDGVDTGAFGDHAAGTASLVACAGALRALPVHEFVRQLAQELFGTESQPDDLTLFGLEVQ